MRIGGSTLFQLGHDVYDSDRIDDRRLIDRRCRRRSRWRGRGCLCRGAAHFRAEAQLVENRFFKSILNKLGFGPDAAAPTAQAPAAAPATAPVTPATPAVNQAPVVDPIAVVDVVAQLEKRAAANPQKLNWRTSIVDLLKLLDIDSSLDARKALATELAARPN